MERCLIAILISLAIGCDRTAPSGPSSAGISGRVIEFSTGAGVSGATVAFGDASAVTDASGTYRIERLASGSYAPRVDGVWMGQSRVTGSSYRGDLLVHPGTCVSRYGTVADARTHRPIAGATVGFLGPGITASTVSGSDGWYRIDLGCPTSGLIGFNTTVLAVSHSNYMNASPTVGRGVSGVSRLDVDLDPR